MRSMIVYKDCVYHAGDHFVQICHVNNSTSIWGSGLGYSSLFFCIHTNTSTLFVREACWLCSNKALFAKSKANTLG